MRTLVLGAAAVACVVAYSAHMRVVQDTGEPRDSSEVNRQASPESAAPAASAPLIPSKTENHAGGLQDELDALLREGGADAVLKAHKLVAKCARENYFSRKLGAQPSTSECTDVFAKYGNQYMQWLSQAVAAGQVGSASAFLEAGPFGDMDSLETRADDPLVKAWKKQAMELLERDAKAHDLQATLSLYEQYRNGAITDVEIPKAFGSLVVAKELMLASGETKLGAAAQKELDRLSKRINQEQMGLAYQYVNFLKGKGGS